MVLPSESPSQDTGGVRKWITARTRGSACGTDWMVSASRVEVATRVGMLVFFTFAGHISDRFLAKRRGLTGVVVGVLEVGGWER